MRDALLRAHADWQWMPAAWVTSGDRGGAEEGNVRNRLGWFFTGLLFAAVAVAQVQTGSISGTVKDKAGAVVPGATVVAHNVDTGAERKVVSANDGVYTIPGLLPGVYELRFTSGNFEPYKQRVEVTVGGKSTLDATLGVSAMSTTVEVSAEAAGVEVNTQTQEQSQVISQQQIAELPSLTRNPYDFIALAGNVSGGDRSSQAGNMQTSGGGQNSTDRGVGTPSTDNARQALKSSWTVSKTSTSSIPPWRWRSRRTQ
jgi:hypothetical protein